MPAAGAEAVPLQQHADAAGLRRCGAAPQREIINTVLLRSDDPTLKPVSLQRFELMEGQPPAPSYVLRVAPSKEVEVHADVTLRVADADVTAQV